MCVYHKSIREGRDIFSQHQTEQVRRMAVGIPYKMSLDQNKAFVRQLSFDIPWLPILSVAVQADQIQEAEWPLFIMTKDIPTGNSHMPWVW